MLSFLKIEKAGNSTEFKTFEEINKLLFPIGYNPNIFSSGCSVFLIQLDETPIGAFSLKGDSQSAYVFTFGILQHFRCMGFGSQSWLLLEKLVSEMLFSKTIELHVHCTNMKAIEFYKKHGFKIKSMVENYYEDLPCNSAYFLEKNISDQNHTFI